MTTSWSLIAQGRPAEALATHVSGSLLALLALACGIGAMIVALQGRRLSWLPGERLAAGAAVVVAMLVFGEWIVRVLSH